MSDIVRQQRLRRCLHTPLRTTEVHTTLSKQQEKLLVLKILKLSACTLRINNQLDASNIQNLFCHETLLVSGIFCVHHQELSAVHLAIGMLHAAYVAAS
jgi:hypothetical protein